MFGLIAAIAGKVLPRLFDVVDQAVEDKDEANKLKAEIHTAMLAMDAKELEGAVSIILAEAKGSWLQRNWRPMLMLIIMIIIFNNYVLFPYLSMWTDKVAVLDLPGGLWALLTTGVGGYVVGRSGEKIAEKMRGE